MSQENVEIVRSVYDAWARDEYPGPPDLLDKEIEYVNPPEAVEPGTRHGLAAFSEALKKGAAGGGPGRQLKDAPLCSFRDTTGTRHPVPVNRW